MTPGGDKATRKLGVGKVVTYKFYGLTKSGCPKHACLKEIHPSNTALSDFPFGKLVFGIKFAKCCICNVSFTNKERVKVPRIEIQAMFLKNRSGWKAPKCITANFCLKCSPELFGVINRNNSAPSSNQWRQKYLLPNASSKLLLSTDTEDQMNQAEKSLLNSACKQANIQIIR
jgi:hypothetical protein